MYLMAKGSFPGGSDGKASAYNAGDLGSIPGLGRSPGEGNGNPLQYSCLENPTDRGAWQATVHAVPKSRTRLSDFTFSCHRAQALEHGLSSCGTQVQLLHDMWDLPRPVIEPVFLHWQAGF